MEGPRAVSLHIKEYQRPRDLAAAFLLGVKQGKEGGGADQKHGVGVDGYEAGVDAQLPFCLSLQGRQNVCFSWELSCVVGYSVYVSGGFDAAIRETPPDQKAGRVDPSVRDQATEGPKALDKFGPALGEGPVGAKVRPADMKRVAVERRGGSLAARREDGEPGVANLRVSVVQALPQGCAGGCGGAGGWGVSVLRHRPVAT